MTQVGQVFGNEIGHITKGLMARYHSSGQYVSVNEEDDHRDQHDGPLEGIGIHNPFQASQNDV